jgi:hypothetical protein
MEQSSHYNAQALPHLRAWREGLGMSRKQAVEALVELYHAARNCSHHPLK